MGVPPGPPPPPALAVVAVVAVVQRHGGRRQPGGQDAERDQHAAAGRCTFTASDDAAVAVGDAGERHARRRR